jgi:hypothetical protein
MLRRSLRDQTAFFQVSMFSLVEAEPIVQLPHPDFNDPTAKDRCSINTQDKMRGAPHQRALCD